MISKRPRSTTVVVVERQLRAMAACCVPSVRSSASTSADVSASASPASVNSASRQPRREPSPGYAGDEAI
jgi:hypothetical protein